MSRASERRSPSFNYRFMSARQPGRDGRHTVRAVIGLSPLSPRKRNGRRRRGGGVRDRNCIVFPIAGDRVTCACVRCDGGELLLRCEESGSDPLPPLPLRLLRLPPPWHEVGYGVSG